MGAGCSRDQSAVNVSFKQDPQRYTSCPNDDRTSYLMVTVPEHRSTSHPAYNRSPRDASLRTSYTADTSSTQQSMLNSGQSIRSADLQQTGMEPAATLTKSYVQDELDPTNMQAKNMMTIHKPHPNKGYGDGHRTSVPMGKSDEDIVLPDAEAPLWVTGDGGLRPHGSHPQRFTFLDNRPTAARLAEAVDLNHLGFYFEMKVLDGGVLNKCSIGFCTRACPLEGAELGGSSSCGFRSDGRVYGCPDSSALSPRECKFAAGSVVGVGTQLVSRSLRRMFFTKDGQVVGIWCSQVPTQQSLYPAISGASGVVVEANFGQHKAFSLSNDVLSRIAPSFAKASSRFVEPLLTKSIFTRRSEFGVEENAQGQLVFRSPGHALAQSRTLAVRAAGSDISEAKGVGCEFYFEATVVQMGAGRRVYVGFADEDVALDVETGLGFESLSVGYHAKGKLQTSCSCKTRSPNSHCATASVVKKRSKRNPAATRARKPPPSWPLAAKAPSESLEFTQGSTVGVGIKIAADGACTVICTRDGRVVGQWSAECLRAHTLFPTVGGGGGVVLEVNCGHRPFRWSDSDVWTHLPGFARRLPPRVLNRWSPSVHLGADHDTVAFLSREPISLGPLCNAAQALTVNLCLRPGQMREFYFEAEIRKTDLDADAAAASVFMGFCFGDGIWDCKRQEGSPTLGFHLRSDSNDERMQYALNSVLGVGVRVEQAPDSPAGHMECHLFLTKNGCIVDSRKQTVDKQVLFPMIGGQRGLEARTNFGNRPYEIAAKLLERTLPDFAIATRGSQAIFECRGNGSDTGMSEQVTYSVANFIHFSLNEPPPERYTSASTVQRACTRTLSADSSSGSSCTYNSSSESSTTTDSDGEGAAGIDIDSHVNGSQMRRSSSDFKHGED